MAKKSREEIKSEFKNGMKPNQENFADLIDSAVNFVDDGVQLNNGNLGVKTDDPKASLHVYDNGSDSVKPGTGHEPSVMIGREDGLNLSLDNNEIAAKNGGSASVFYLQRDGGDMILFDADSDARIVLKDSGNIGIGTNTPDGRLHVKGTAVDFLVKETGKTGIGVSDPVTNLQIQGSDQNFRTDSSNANFIIGDENGEHMAMDLNTIQAKSNNSTGGSLYLNSFGGEVYAGNSVVQTSDKRLKKEIKSLNDCLEKVKALRPVSYKWRKGFGNETDVNFGFIAQEVEKVIEEVTYKNEKNQHQGISYAELIPVLTNAIQEQQTQMETMEKRLAKLEKMMAKK